MILLPFTPIISDHDDVYCLKGISNYSKVLLKECSTFHLLSIFRVYSYQNRLLQVRYINYQVKTTESIYQQ